MLYQPTTTGPLMGKLVPLALIASVASKYHIIDIMTRTILNTTHGNSVFKMEDIPPVPFLKSILAVVTTIVLFAQFVLYLLRCESTRDALIASRMQCISSAPFSILTEISLSRLTSAYLTSCIQSRMDMIRFAKELQHFGELVIA